MRSLCLSRRLSGDVMKVFHRDIWRSIRKGWKRFLSILIITALGVGMMTGLYAACLDMYYSADQFFDEQNLFDIRILSTLGLTQEDVDILTRIEGVDAVEGGYIEAVSVDMTDTRKTADMTVLSEVGLNMPQLLSGVMPTKKGEIAVTPNYLEESGKMIGDTLTIEEDMETSTLMNTIYTITGVVLDPKDIRGNDEMGKNLRSTLISDYTFFITKADADNDIFTVVYLVLSETKELNCYSDEYEGKVRGVIDNIESRIKVQREQARYDDVLNEAQTEIAEAEDTMNEKFAEADQKFADAWMDISEGRQELLDAEATLLDEQKDAEGKIAEARDKLEKAKQEIAEAQEKLRIGEEELIEGEAQLRIGEQELAAGEKELVKGEKELEEAEKKLIEGEQELAAGKKTLMKSEQELAAGEKQLIEAEKQLEDGEKQLVQGEAELEVNAQKLAEGKRLLAEEREKALEQFAGVEKEFSKAQSQLDAARIQAESGAAQLKDAFGDEWPVNEWNAFVNAVAALAVTGVDDGTIAAATASENGALIAVIEEINGQTGQTDPAADVVAQAAFGMGKVNGGQQSLDEQKSSFMLQKEAALQKIDESEAELIAGEIQLGEMRRMIEAQKEELNVGKSRLTEERSKLEFGKESLAKGWEEWKAGEAELEEGRAKWEAGKIKLFEGWDEWRGGKAELAESWSQWEDGKKELEKGRSELEKGKEEIKEGEAKLNKEEADARIKIKDAWNEIADGKEELEEGEIELIEKEQEYAEEREEAQQELADAYAELNDIDMTKWYVQDRTSLDSYSSLDSDLSSIEGVGRLFPVIFLLVAVLMSLTTMTRMVEEERGLIGTYKALGFGNVDIYRKYLLFAFAACVLGGILGDVFGFIFMPRFVEIILKTLYSLPQYYLRFDILYGVGGAILFMLAIMGATALACHNELKQMPAALLRPKSPRAGTRVWLEHIPVIWNRLKFLNKVTVRNLFRYKKRLFMTIGGIAGCTALIICGFAIKDSVLKLAPSQYNDIYRYDLLAVFEEKDNDDMIRQIASDDNIENYINLRMESVKLLGDEGESSAVQLIVIPDGSSIEDYIHLEKPDGKPILLENNGVLVTQNAARILGLKTDDTASLQNLQLEQNEVTVSGVVKNYLGNNVYMTQKLYESLFGVYEPNSVLAHLSAVCADQPAYAEKLLDHDSVLSAVSVASLLENFGFDLINAVVLLLIVMAGGLAFVVLFTLSNTNISERVRELATIKVLGFYEKEVYQYVNKETLILTVIGILVGLPVGRMVSSLLTTALNMPSIHFAVYIEPVSYLFSVAITFCFAVIVNLITNRSLDRINMVEALKSVE